MVGDRAGITITYMWLINVMLWRILGLIRAVVCKVHVYVSEMAVPC